MRNELLRLRSKFVICEDLGQTVAIISQRFVNFSSRARISQKVVVVKVAQKFEIESTSQRTPEYYFCNKTLGFIGSDDCRSFKNLQKSLFENPVRESKTLFIL